MSNLVEEILEKENAVLITTDCKTVEDIKEISPKNGTDFSLEEMYGYCNCRLIEPVYLPKDKIMICDEEGAIVDEPKLNRIATDLISAFACSFTPIFGNVIIVNDNQFK